MFDWPDGSLQSNILIHVDISGSILPDIDMVKGLNILACGSNVLDPLSLFMSMII
jgi:hypothetical protein